MSKSLLTSPDLSPEYSFLFNFEKTFEYNPSRSWMIQRWHESIYWSILYTIIIYSVKFYMSTRLAFSLRYAMAAWNAFFAIFSTIGALRTSKEVFHVRKFGLYQSVCNPSYFTLTPPSAFWAWMFALSKFPELWDTLFIVLRKRELTFLHWYHHVSAFISTWYLYSKQMALARWYNSINFSVHSIMYSYFVFRSLNYKIPKYISIIITFAQVFQMAVDFCLTLYAYYLKVIEGAPCQLGNLEAYICLWGYAIYFYLFGTFFVNTYLKPKKSPN